MVELVYERVFTEIPKLDGWCSPEKAVRLAKAVIETEAKISVELGVYGGRGVIAMAMTHKTLQSGRAWGFDPWTKAAACEGKNDPANDEWWSKLDLEAIYRVFVEKVHSYSLLPWLFWARLKSEQAVKIFEDESVDVIHIDGNHSEKNSCFDVTAWAPKVKSGGFLIMDDIDWETTKKAQALLLTKGFLLIEDYKNWAVYKKK